MTLALVVIVLVSRPVQAQMASGPDTRPPILREVGVDQRLGEQAPLELEFRDEQGNAVKLGQYFGRKPVVLALVYYECPMLCTQVLNGLTSALKVLKFDAGKEFEIVTVSFDARETPAMAAAKKENYLARYGRPQAAAGWHFLTGEQASIDALTKSVGFRYAWDERGNQFAHASAIMVLTPEGKLAQYYYGIEYSPKDLRLGLVEASQHKIGNFADKVLLYCFHYDPATGKYGVIIMNVLRLTAVATLLALGIFMGVMFRRDLRAARRSA
jgi:protein SCO1/2